MNGAISRFAALWVFVSLLLARVASAETGPLNHKPFDDILRDTVVAERVDYLKLQQKHAASLENYLNMLASKDLTQLPRDEQLAAYINLYNATMIKAVLDRDPKTFKPSGNDFSVFKERLVRLSGQTISLNDLENDIVRKQFKDPRIHAALVCGALSCPPILNRAYRADDLDQVLTDNVKRWLNDPARNAFDADNKKLKLSMIFNWYADDFGGKDKVADFVTKYGGRDATGFAVEFQEYDWSLNRSR